MVGRYLANHDGTCDYEDMNNQADIAAYKVFAKDNIARGNKEAAREPLTNSGGNAGARSGKRFPKMESEFGKSERERKKIPRKENLA